MLDREAEVPREVDQEQRDARRDHERADRRDQVQRVPAETAGIRINASRHAGEPRDVHREERDVDPDEHQSEHPAAGALGQRSRADEGNPVVERREQRKHHPADQHVMQMRDDEIRIVRLPVERDQRHHDTGQAAKHENEEEAQHEERRRRELELPSAIVAIQEKTWMPLGMATAMLAAVKKPSDMWGMPVGNMW